MDFGMTQKDLKGVFGMGACSYCGKKLRKHFWIGFYSNGSQCDRLLCRIKTGHWLYMKFHRKLEFRKIPLIPKLSKVV